MTTTTTTIVALDGAGVIIAPPLGSRFAVSPGETLHHRRRARLGRVPIFPAPPPSSLVDIQTSSSSLIVTGWPRARRRPGPTTGVVVDVVDTAAARPTPRTRAISIAVSRHGNRVVVVFLPNPFPPRPVTMGKICRSVALPRQPARSRGFPAEEGGGDVIRSMTSRWMMPRTRTWKTFQVAGGDRCESSGGQERFRVRSSSMKAARPKMAPSVDNECI